MHYNTQVCSVYSFVLFIYFFITIQFLSVPRVSDLRKSYFIRRNAYFLHFFFFSNVRCTPYRACYDGFYRTSVRISEHSLAHKAPSLGNNLSVHGYRARKRGSRSRYRKMFFKHAHVLRGARATSWPRWRTCRQNVCGSRLFACSARPGRRVGGRVDGREGCSRVRVRAGSAARTRWLCPGPAARLSADGREEAAGFASATRPCTARGRCVFLAFTHERRPAKTFRRPVRRCAARGGEGGLSLTPNKNLYYVYGIFSLSVLLYVYISDIAWNEKICFPFSFRVLDPANRMQMCYELPITDNGLIYANNIFVRICSL